MKITLKVHGAVREFSSFADLGQHYGELGTAFRNMSMNQKTQKEQRFYEGKAAAYDVVAWQMSQITIEE